MAVLIDSSVFIGLERRGLRPDELVALVPDVLTDNVREYGRVPGLIVRQPQWPR